LKTEANQESMKQLATYLLRKILSHAMAFKKCNSLHDYNLLVEDSFNFPGELN